MSTSTHSHAQHFLDKLDELRAIFVLGRRSFPFLQEIIGFVQDITVLLEEVDATIQERTGHMTRATSRLESVSEATELATGEILDLIDEVLSTTQTLEEALAASEGSFDDLADADERLLALLQNELGDEHSELLAAAERIGHEKNALRRDAQDKLEAAREALSPIRSRMNRITMSLQVQDITAQQIASVNHLIESVRSRMNALLERLGSGDVSESDIPSDKPPRTAAFDSNARYDHSSERQDMADDLVASMGDGSDGSASASPAPRSADAESAAGGGPASQQDIDAMFDTSEASSDGTSEADASADASSSPGTSTGDAADGGAGEVASQEDIDELFQQGL